MTTHFLAALVLVARAVGLAGSLAVSAARRRGAHIVHQSAALGDEIAHSARAVAVQHFDRRVAGSPELAAHAMAPAAFVRLALAGPCCPPPAPTRPTPSPWEALDAWFAPAFARPGHRRLASMVFSAAVVLSAVGVAGALTVDPAAAPRATRVASDGAPPRVAAAAPPEAAAAAASGPAAAATDTTAAVAEPPAAAATPPAPAAPAPAGVIASKRGGLPIGKGMWIWLHDRAEGGDAHAIVARAKTWGFTHLYVRTATLREGFMAAAFLDRLLPAAHAAGLRVYGWDFPYMYDPGSDVNRALAAIRHTTPDGHRLDGFAPDIETRFEGTNENLEQVRAYVNWLRQNVGPDYPLIAVVPNPTPGRVARGYPYADIVAPFDGVAPMVYWMNRDPAADVANAIGYLQQFGKPVFPIGQAYDGAIDGGPPGIPGRDAIQRFMQTAHQLGADGISFWSWQHASQEAWNAIGDAQEFRLGHGPPETMPPAMVRGYQLQLAFLGYGVAVNGQWSPEMAATVDRFQRDHGLAPSGHIDPATAEMLLRPRSALPRPG